MGVTNTWDKECEPVTMDCLLIYWNQENSQQQLQTQSFLCTVPEEAAFSEKKMKL